MRQAPQAPQASQASQAPHGLFERRLAGDRQSLVRDQLTTVQISLGRMCNLACAHCHVDAGPKRTEIMPWAVMERILGWIDEQRRRGARLGVDLTGGAPELNPQFRRLVTALRDRDLPVLDRCNLTILLEPGQEGLVEFLACHRVGIVASLPCYLADNVDAQRGRGVYARSIRALRLLNEAGYGQAESDLTLDLVYNPVGFSLPPAQDDLERAYKRELADRAGVVFHRLWALANMPIQRFERQLRNAGEYEDYLELLSRSHRRENVDSVMCRSLVSVDWRGVAYDCDFNQMLGMPLAPAGRDDDGAKLWELSASELTGRSIRTGVHCFGCTAGAGSSCQGALA